ncbi:uncharacterized protein H6S33_004916 [Morchella sextelata]|uniref:uncharacterized protein n=1 Tax=Morchella sextelata TaxID=1174677 RepID=UPI001D03D954|nr:uncharacterized protein H6S33_004916 [Morchella sextelata]KAH0604934.1 hypothetical protein H6S33_004916 [Morchella sextelata]
MSRGHQQQMEEDYNMESSITVRDRGIVETQARQRHRRDLDMPISDLFRSTQPAVSYGQPRSRRQGDYRDYSPYKTPIRERSSIPRPSVPRVTDEDEDTDMDVEERRIEHPFGEIIGQEIERRGAPVVQQLSRGLGDLTVSVQDLPAIREITRQHAAQLTQQHEEQTKLIRELQMKFNQDQEERERREGYILAQVRAETAATTTNLGQVLEQIADTTRAHQQRQEEQAQHITMLADWIQRLPKEGPAQVPDGVSATLAQLERTMQQQVSLVDGFSGTKTALEEMIEQMKETARKAAAEKPLAPETGGGGSGPPPRPPPQQPVAPPAGSESSENLEDPGQQGKQGGQGAQGGGNGDGNKGGGQGAQGGGNGNGNKGGNAPEAPGSSPSDSSDSEGERRKRLERKKRRHERRRQREQELSHPPRTTIGDAPKKANIPFSGSADQDVRLWIDQMEILISLQKKVQWDDGTKIMWASLEFTGSAANFWRNFTERLAVDRSIGTWERFKQELRTQYGNRTSQEQAKQKMDRLRQTGPIDDYINEMQNLEWDARVGPVVMRSMILTGINSSLEQRLSNAIEEPNDFVDWLAWVRKVGRKDHEVKARKEILRGKDPVKPREEKTERRKSRNNANPRKTSSASANNSKTSDDLGVTKEEKEKWQKEGKCFRCGRDNHFVKDCVATSKVRLTNLKRKEYPSGRKDHGREGDKKRKLEPRNEAFRARITNLED